MDTFKDLKPMTGNIEPIGVAEREQRLAKLRSVMAEHGVDGLFLEPAHTMLYFLGLSGGLTERLTAAVIPAEGEAQLNTAVATFFNFDWANKTAQCYVCDGCGYIHWFLPKK